MFKVLCLASFLSLCSLSAAAQGRVRFEPDQLSFELVDNTTGITIECTHKILPHVPWWKVSCDDRLYTVDTWLQVRSRGDLFEKTLLYHASEGIQSSSMKLVQFKSHMTSFITRGESDLLGMVSSKTT
jgi:hypothetical protein